MLLNSSQFNHQIFYCRWLWQATRTPGWISWPCSVWHHDFRCVSLESFSQAAVKISPIFWFFFQSNWTLQGLLDHCSPHEIWIQALWICLSNGLSLSPIVQLLHQQIEGKWCFGESDETLWTPSSKMHWSNWRGLRNQQLLWSISCHDGWYRSWTVDFRHGIFLEEQNYRNIVPKFFRIKFDWRGWKGNSCPTWCQKIEICRKSNQASPTRKLVAKIKMALSTTSCLKDERCNRGIQLKSWTKNIYNLVNHR